MGSLKTELKESISIVLSPDVLQRLNENWIEIRRLSTSSISKSVVVEESLKIAFAEFDLKKEQSQFCTNIIDVKKKASKKTGQKYKKQQPTFSMSSQIIKEAREHLEHFSSLSPNIHITMKRMVEEALKLAFDEFELRKGESQFYLNIWNLEETQHSIKQRKINYGPRRKRINFKTSMQFLKQFHEKFEEMQKLCGRNLKTSSIAEESIKIALEDFESRKQNSSLFMNLTNREEREKKGEIGLSFSLDLVQIIEKYWIEIRNIMNSKIPFIYLVEESINIALNDFELKKEESQIYKRLCLAQKSLF